MNKSEPNEEGDLHQIALKTYRLGGLKSKIYSTPASMLSS